MTRDKHIGRRVRTLEQLHALALARKSVICPRSYSFGVRKPAAFVLNLNGDVLRRLFWHGLFVYKPQREKRRQPEAET